MTRSARGLGRRLSSALLLSVAFLSPANAAPQDEIRATFERFVVAQNDHDISKVEPLLLASPDFLWITRGMDLGQRCGAQAFRGALRGDMAARTRADGAQDCNGGSGCGTALRADHFHNRRGGSAGPDDPVSHEPSAGQDEWRLARFQHLAGPGPGPGPGPITPACHTRSPSRVGDPATPGLFAPSTMRVSLNWRSTASFALALPGRRRTSLWGDEERFPKNVMRVRFGS
jgi:hypothetical protein